MPSIEENLAFVRGSLASSASQDFEHDAVLSQLQVEIDKHNALRNDVGGRMRKRRRRHDAVDERKSAQRDLKHSGRFRFKDGESLSTHKNRTKKSSGLRQQDYSPGASSNKVHLSQGSEDDTGTAHPFPREPTKPTDSPSYLSTDAAFRASLFDALADDEAATYWAEVYGEPIHVYTRPQTANAQGELERMTDDEYVEYVKRRMWERRNPEVVLERERNAKEKRRKEEEKAKRREEFVRRKEREAWERDSRWKGNEDDNDADNDADGYEYVGPRVAPDAEEAAARAALEQAWTEYLSAWQRLQSQPPPPDRSSTSTPPYPVLPGQAVKKPLIESFLLGVPLAHAGLPSRLALLKAERVRWHPDKVQQRLGMLDEATLRTVTGVFRVVDGLVDAERSKVADAAARP